MWYDANGNIHETYLGELSGAGRQGRQHTPTVQAAGTQQSTQQEEQFPRRVFEIIFVDNRDQIGQFKVNSGCDQIFAAKDDSFFCVKAAVGNTYTEEFYTRENTPAQGSASDFFTRQEIPALISAVVAEINRQKEAE